MKSGKAFTLIEILLVVSIIVILGAISSDYIITGFKASNFDYEQAEAIEHARNAMLIMTKEIRGANSSEQGHYLLLEIATSSLTFYNDIDKDEERERVRYVLEGNLLKKVITEPGSLNDYTGTVSTTTLSDYLNNGTDSIFSYYDGNYSITSSINNVRLISIFLKVNVTPSRAPNDYILNSDVQLRNIKDNL